MSALRQAMHHSVVDLLAAAQAHARSRGSVAASRLEPLGIMGKVMAMILTRIHRGITAPYDGKHQSRAITTPVRRVQRPIRGSIGHHSQSNECASLFLHLKGCRSFTRCLYARHLIYGVSEHGPKSCKCHFHFQARLSQRIMECLFVSRY